MDADPLFTQEIVREFMLSHDGKVSNPILVSHFKNFLNNPIRKIANRQQFKTYINTLATVKLDSTGVKLLVLKKKFRDDSFVESFSKVNVEELQERDMVREIEPTECCIQSNLPESFSNVEDNEATQTECLPKVYKTSGKSETTWEDCSDGSTNKNISQDAEKKVVPEKATNSEILRESTEVFKELPATQNQVSKVKSATLNIEKLELDQSSIKNQPKSKRETRKIADTNNDYDIPVMSDIEREWLLSSCSSDYQSLCKMLQHHPHLSSKRDFITGYSALHWACKNGNMDVVKLLCGKYSADVNQRTFGGYTPLHVASIMKREEVAELLIKVYKANTALRDYSGKLAKSYLVSSNHPQLFFMPKKDGVANSSNASSFLKTTSNQMSRNDKENTFPVSLPLSCGQLPSSNSSALMPPPSMPPLVLKRKPTGCTDKSAHSDSEAADDVVSLTMSSHISGSSPNFESIV